MEHFELVEKLVNTFGVSYEEAKTALEKSGWDPVEAAVILERAKNGMPEPEPVVKEEPEPAREPKGSFDGYRSTVKEEGTKIFKTVWDFLNLNEFVVKKSSGEVFLNLPLWIAVLLLCAFFWPVVFILGIVFLMGYRFSFSGPNLGKKNVKGSVETEEKAKEDYVEPVENPCAEEPVKTEEPKESIFDTVVKPEEKADEGTENSGPADPAA